MEEVWKNIAGYEGLYQISNSGRVKSLNYRGHGYEKILVPKVNNSGRLWVELARNGKSKPFLIHRLVGSAFLPNPLGYKEINHIDENPQNNDVRNLEWCSHKYNVNYYFSKHPHGPNRKCSSKYGDRKSMEIEQCLADGTVVRRWANSRTIFSQTGMSDWSISECCRGNRKTAYGYVWRYANSNISAVEKPL